MSLNKLNLALLDHDIHAVRDQVYFLQKTLQKSNIKLVVQRNIDTNLKNVVIEGKISEKYSKELKFMGKNPHQFSMLITENLTIENNQFLINGVGTHQGINQDLDPNLKANERFNALIESGSGVSLFMTCGGYPDSLAYEKLFPTITFANLPWPEVKFRNVQPHNSGLIFSVPHSKLITPFRKSIIAEIKNQGINVRIAKSKNIKQSIKQLNHYSGSLDIPKTASWKFDSPMRSFIAVSAQRPKITLRDNDSSTLISRLVEINYLDFLSYSHEKLNLFIAEIPSNYRIFCESQDKKPIELLLAWVTR